MGLESGSLYASLSEKEIKGNTSSNGTDSEFYPYPLANPDIWRSVRATASTAYAWTKNHLQRQRYQFAGENAGEKMIHTGKIMAAGAWAMYPFVSDAINVVVSRVTGNPILAPAITTGIDIPILYAQAKVWENSVQRKDPSTQIDNPEKRERNVTNENILPWTSEYENYSRALGRIAGSPESTTPILKSLSEEQGPENQSDEPLRSEERTLTGKALSSLLGHVDHGETLLTTLFAGSQIGLGEETIKINRELVDNDKGSHDIPSAGNLALKHGLVFGAESLALGYLASRGYEGGAVQGLTDLAIKIGLPVFLLDRGTSLYFNTLPQKSLSYKGSEKIVEMVRKGRRKIQSQRNNIYSSQNTSGGRQEEINIDEILDMAPLPAPPERLAQTDSARDVISLLPEASPPNAPAIKSVTETD